MGGCPVTNSSAPSAFYTEAVFRQAGIYLAPGEETEDKDSSARHSLLRKWFHREKKKTATAKILRPKLQRTFSAAHQPRLPFEQTLVTSGIPSLSRNLKEGKISGPGWAGDARVVFNGNYLPMRSLGTRAGLQGAQFPALWGL